MAWKWLSCPSAGPQKGSERMTTIEWTDETWNPTRGCTRISSGCEHCSVPHGRRRSRRSQLFKSTCFPPEENMRLGSSAATRRAPVLHRRFSATLRLFAFQLKKYA